MASAGFIVNSFPPVRPCVQVAGDKGPATDEVRVSGQLLDPTESLPFPHSQALDLSLDSTRQLSPATLSSLGTCSAH